jgi:hypothetical protein
MGQGNFYLVIVAPNDRPVFELELGPHAQRGSESTDEKACRLQDACAGCCPRCSVSSLMVGPATNAQEDPRRLRQFILHAALDPLVPIFWNTPTASVGPLATALALASFPLNAPSSSSLSFLSLSLVRSGHSL